MQYYQLVLLTSLWLAHGRNMLRVRRWLTFVEHKIFEAGHPSKPPVRKVAAVAVVENPYAQRYVDDLSEIIAASHTLGVELAKMATDALGKNNAQSYGKGGVVGLDGEQEHANALLTTVFANPLREAIGGGKAWISSFTKRAAPGAQIDIPLASKDALYVRSHYDGMTLTLPETPMPDEVAVIICLANRGRPNARVGGLRYEDIKGDDGLV
jgi:hypothetical protein